jgi:hypothetical protein
MIVTIILLCVCAILILAAFLKYATKEDESNE